MPKKPAQPKEESPELIPVANSPEPREMVKCGCGMDVSKKGMSSHKKSNKHIASMTKKDMELNVEYKEFGNVIQTFIDKAVENRLNALAGK